MGLLLDRNEIARLGFFFVLFLLALAVVASLLGVFDFVVGSLLPIVAVVALALLLLRENFLLRLQDFQRAIIMRFGKVNRVGGPGWAVVLPFVEQCTLVDLRTQVVDIPKQQVIIKDNLELDIDAVIFLRVKPDRESVISSVVEVEDYKKAIGLFVTAKLRDVVGSLDLETVVSDVNRINNDLSREVELFSNEWGIHIERVEISDITLPKSVLEAMHQQKAAVQEKLAAFERAEARKAEIDAVNKATESLSDRALTYYYIKALEEMSKGQSTKLVFPIEVSRLAESISKSLPGKTEVSTEMVDAFLKRQEKKK